MASKNNRKRTKSQVATRSKQDEAQATVFHQSSAWIAPLPPPEILNAYPENIQQDIIDGAKEYRQHGIKVGAMSASTENFIARLSSVTYSVVTIGVFALAGICVVYDKSLGAIAFTTLGTIIGAVPILTGKQSKNKDESGQSSQ